MLLGAALLAPTTFAMDMSHSMPTGGKATNDHDALMKAKPTIKNCTTLPRHIGLLLTPSVTPIDLFGPLDVFSGFAMAFNNQTGPMHLTVLSADNATTTTAPPIPGLPGFGMDLVPTISLADYLDAQAKGFKGNASHGLPGPLDVILIPGGGGTRQNVTREIAFVKEVYPHLKSLITVCTGSTIAARAGVLDGKRATTNKMSWTWATSFGKDVKYQTHARWVQDGNLWTGSGVSAAVDTAYAWLAGTFGEEAAQWVADVSEYTRWTNGSYDPFADRWGLGAK
jgi:putative intracellular protease/amidase